MKTDIRKDTRKVLYLHRFITHCPEGMYVDHISLDTLDNRKSNLRICTWQQNNFNKISYSHNTSGFRGVIWRKDRNRWMAQISVNKHNIYLGVFKNIEGAIAARKEAEEKYFGDFRYKEITNG